MELFARPISLFYCYSNKIGIWEIRQCGFFRQVDTFLQFDIFIVLIRSPHTKSVGTRVFWSFRSLNKVGDTGLLCEWVPKQAKRHSHRRRVMTDRVKRVAIAALLNATKEIEGSGLVGAAISSDDDGSLAVVFRWDDKISPESASECPPVPDA